MPGTNGQAAVSLQNCGLSRACFSISPLPSEAGRGENGMTGMTVTSTLEITVPLSHVFTFGV